MTEMANINPMQAGSDGNTKQAITAKVKLEWSEIAYSVNVGTSDNLDMKTILHPISGSAKPHEMMAIMGTSGAGKSTFLDILAGRLISDDVTGQMLANGNPIDFKNLRRMSGYVMQSDALFPHLTVRETIQYAAYLRCHKKTEAQCNSIAEELIKLLKLESCADTIIGNDIVRGVSGGQKRRVTIAVDIVHQPSVIFLDEPTSGLDSVTTLSLTSALRSIAKDTGKTIVMTIHQPSSKVFNMFDKVLFLSEGNVTYLGKVRDLMPYCRKFYLKHSCFPPEATSEEEKDLIFQGNPPEVFLELCDQMIADGKTGLLFDDISAHLGIGEHANSAAQLDNPNRLSVFGGQEGKNLGELKLVEYANDIIPEIKILMSRAFKSFSRTPEVFHARVGAATIFGLLVGTLFFQTHNNSQGTSDRASYFIFTNAFFLYTALDALQIILQEREIFQREFSRGAYRGISYVLSGTFIILPFMFLIAVVFTSISYFLVNLPAVGSLYLFDMFQVFLILTAGFCYAQMISVIAPDPMAGQVMGSGILSIMFLTSGFFIHQSEIPPWWIWMYYLSLFHWGFNPLMINGLSKTEYDGMDAQDIMSQYDLEGESKWLGVGMLILFCVLYRVNFYFQLVNNFSGERK
jgi:ABC-type multidrug transport system ATPase subunit/ABC-type multidrug transport system permease subunit